MTTSDLKPTTRVFHIRTGRAATVKMQPRAHSTGVCLVLDGNATQQYYAIKDVFPGDKPPTAEQLEQHRKEHALPPAREGSTPQGSSENSVTNEAPDTLGNLVAKAHGVGVQRAATNSYEGDLTLTRLREMRQKIRAGLDDLDVKIAQIVSYDAVRDALNSIQFKGETMGRAVLSADALKIQRDTAQAQAAADRLFVAVKERAHAGK